MAGKYNAKSGAYKGQKFQSQYEMNVFIKYQDQLTRLKPAMRYFEITTTTKRAHTPDFQTKKGLCIETKGAVTKKYRQQIELLVETEGDRFRSMYAILFQNADVSAGGLKLTAGEWASKLGLRWHSGTEIPEEWFHIDPKEAPLPLAKFLCYPLALSGEPLPIVRAFKALKSSTHFVGDGALIKACLAFHKNGMTHFAISDYRKFCSKNKLQHIRMQLCEAMAQHGRKRFTGHRIKNPIANAPMYFHTGQPLHELAYVVGNHIAPYAFVIDLDGSLAEHLANDAVFADFFEQYRCIYVPLPERHLNSEYIPKLFEYLSALIPKHQRISEHDSPEKTSTYQQDQTEAYFFNAYEFRQFYTKGFTELSTPINCTTFAIALQHMLDNGRQPVVNLDTSIEFSKTTPWRFHL